METCHWQIDHPITFPLSAPRWDQLSKWLQYFISSKEQPVRCSYVEWLLMYSQSDVGAVWRSDRRQLSLQPGATTELTARRLLVICFTFWLQTDFHCVQKENNRDLFQCWCTVLLNTGACLALIYTWHHTDITCLMLLNKMLKMKSQCICQSFRIATASRRQLLLSVTLWCRLLYLYYCTTLWKPHKRRITLMESECWDNLFGNFPCVKT